jgi:hypothetical protein
MKNRNIRYRRTIPTLLIALVLGCFPLLPAVQADTGGKIVGLWHVFYTSDVLGPLFESYDQWLSDGQEFEVANVDPTAGVGNICQGTWIKTPNGGVKLFHVGWTFGGNCGTDVRFDETQINTIGPDGNSYDGTYDIKYYDANGNLACEDTGTLQATRLSVNTSLVKSLPRRD